MEQIKEFVDERQNSWCIHCGGWLSQLETNKDHVPSRGLLLSPHPANPPLVRVCTACNTSFSLDEEYVVAFLSSILAGSTDPVRQSSPKAARILTRSPKLRTKIERSKVEQLAFVGDSDLHWRPEHDRIQNVVLKNARGHAFFECGEPMLEPPQYIMVVPIEQLSAAERSAFESIDFGGIAPEVGSRMLTRMFTAQDMAGGWVMVQDDVYRYAVTVVGGLVVRSVLYEYLATEVSWVNGYFADFNGRRIPTSRLKSSYWRAIGRPSARAT
jgi:hypothetical protein